MLFGLGVSVWGALGAATTAAGVAGSGRSIADFLRNPGQVARQYAGALVRDPARAAGVALEVLLRRIPRPARDWLARRLGAIHRPGRDRLGVTEEPLQRGSLGQRFQPGIHDPTGRLLARERETAEFLGREGKDVRVLPEDHTAYGEPSVDVLVRSGPQDFGVLTELKALDQPSSRAVKDRIIRSGQQLEQYGNGQVVLDGRGQNLTREVAESGLRRALGQAGAHGQSFPESVRIILGDGSSLYYP